MLPELEITCSARFRGLGFRVRLVQNRNFPCVLALDASQSEQPLPMLIALGLSCGRRCSSWTFGRLVVQKPNSSQFRLNKKMLLLRAWRLKTIQVIQAMSCSAPKTLDTCLNHAVLAITQTASKSQVNDGKCLLLGVWGDIIQSATHALPTVKVKP